MVELKSGREIRIIGESGKILQKVFRALTPCFIMGLSALKTF